ncbi:hypothetical protein POPTR_013G082700v4 [Populus trichocarpa]|uniref:Nucleoside phosphorylase domain-containing protein n=1 Tax=Populus trichocarpa TaxID=3694 RepID=U5FV36_POPTR|nr:bark storage protein A [Populus trichocarpa]PNT07384.2 hypothetical protein POPTR_013G082700v4 [Populus trichocarpa]|eukprot:XP_006375999.2 bark storage protein A [Populus trichocarpa]
MSSSVNLVVMVVGLLVLAQQSFQMSLRNPVAATNNCKIDFTRLGLVLTSGNNEKALQDSGLFTPDAETPYVDIAGRRFHIGTLNARYIVYVKIGGNSVNAAIAVQILLNRFRIQGIIHFGSAGSLDEKSIVPGDVSVPLAVAFTGAWNWKKLGSDKGALNFGEFNYPVNGENLLASVDYDTIKLFSKGQSPQDVFWFPSTTSWYSAATQVLQDLVLRQCYHGVCLPYKPKIVFGTKGSSSDSYIKNKAYGDFLHKGLNVSTADQESAAVAWTSLSNEKPFIVIRGASNVAGGASSVSQLSYLASYNAFLAAAKFIESIPTPRLACE